MPSDFSRGSIITFFIRRKSFRSTRCRIVWKVEEIFLLDEKIEITLNLSFIVGSFFNAEGSTHGSKDGTVRILGKGVDAYFTFEVDALLDAERLDEVK